MFVLCPDLFENDAYTYHVIWVLSAIFNLAYNCYHRVKNFKIDYN